MRSAQLSRAKQCAMVLLLAMALTGVFLILLCVGRYSVPPLEAFRIMGIALFRDGQALEALKAENPFGVSVILGSRLPRLLMGMIVGAGLSVAGATYQAIFGNPLVSPDILGVSSGAGFGASLGILLSTSTLIIQGSALTFGLLAVLMVFLVSKVNGRTELFTLVLSGVIIQALFDALVSLIKYVSDPQEKLPAITVWLMGSLASSSYKDIIVSCVIILPCIAVLLTLRWKMNLLSLDEEEARSLGVNVHRLRSVVIVLSTLMTGVTVSLCGVIGWIGLVIPQVGRMLVGNDHRALLPASALLGALYLLLIDTIARTATAAEIPLSILTAIIGAPFFAWMLRKTSGGST